MKQNLLILLSIISFQSFAQSKIMSDTIRLQLNKYNTVFVKAVFNEKDTLNLNFDTGTTELVLTNKTLKKLKSVPNLYDTAYKLKIGNTVYNTKVYDAELAGEETDGRFGWDLFKDKIVEINYDLNILVVHSALPKSINTKNKFSKLKIEYFKNLPLVPCEIKHNRVKNKGLYVFDTGYVRTIMLDNDILTQEKFPVERMEILKKVMMKGAQGNEIPVITSNLEQFKIGKYKLNNVPAQILTTNKPLRNKNIHFVGNEILKRFNIFLDFQNNFVYIKPNSLFNDNYLEQQKKGN